MDYAKKIGMSGTELAAFMAQAYHETAGFKYLKEQDYGRGKEYFNKYEIDYNPTLATDLGNKQPGQGYKYRGRGYFQLTGYYNYKKFSNEIGYDIYKKPSVLEDPKWAALSALWFWRDKVKSQVTDFNDVRKITKIINGGYNGLEERTELFKSYKMRINPTVTEGVTIKSQAALIAYCIVVAESYDNAPVYDESAKKHWIALRDHTVNVLYPKIAK
jgi:predicted chitinase